MNEIFKCLSASKGIFFITLQINSQQAKCKQYKVIEVGRSHQLEIGLDDHEEVISELFGMLIKEEFTSTFLEHKKGKIQFVLHGLLIAAASPALRGALPTLPEVSPARDKNKLCLNGSSISLRDLIE